MHEYQSYKEALYFVINWFIDFFKPDTISFEEKND